MRVKPDQIVNGFDASYYLLSNPDVAAAGIDPLTHFLAVGWQEGRMPNAVFDPAYYLAQNSDVADAGVNPLTHYLQSGAAEGRNPSAAFDTAAYLAANPDVAAAGINPMLHYLQNGAFEGRPIAGNLTVGSAGHDFLIGTAGVDSLNGGDGNDFVIAAGGNDTADGGNGTDTVRFSSNFTAYTFTFSGNEVIVDGPDGHDTFTNFERFAFRDVTFERGGNVLIDDFYYYAQNPDVYAAGMDAAFHFNVVGWQEGRNPNAYFDVDYYLTNNPDVAAAGVNPLQHYLSSGASEGRNPSALFDTAAYLEANPDVAAAGINPLLHFLAAGQTEGRSPLGAVQTSVGQNEDTDHVFTAGEFEFGDLASVQSVTIDATGVTNGTLFLDANDDTIIDNGEALSGTGNVVSFADIQAGRLIFRPDADGNGNAYATFGYLATDGSTTATPGVMTINVAAVNDAPTVTAGSGLSYTENQAATAIAGGLTLSDIDSANLSGATVSITANFASAEDVLAFTAQNGITGSYNSGTGVLTLSGSATVAQYQAALRSVTYANTSDTPSTAARTISYQVDDGQAVDHASNIATTTVTVAAVNDAPAVNAQAAAVGYTENGVGVAIAAALTVTDADSANLAGATVSITGNFSAGDTLNFVGQNGITGNYVSGVLTLSGSATVAQYQDALRSVTFSSTSDAPATAARTISFEVDDGQGANHASNVSTASVSVTPVNDAPTGADDTITIDEDGTHTFTAADFGFSDAADGGADTLIAVQITALPGTGTLTLDTGEGPVAVTLNQVISAADIPGLVFTPLPDANGNNYASISFKVQDSGGTANGGIDLATTANTITFDVSPVNDAPRAIAFTQLGDVPEGSVATDQLHAPTIEDPEGDAVGFVTATDFESNNPVTFSLVDENGNPYVGPFQINASTGEITISATATGDSLDYEADDSHAVDLIVRATDSLGAHSEQVISVVLSDVAELNASAIEGYIAGARVFVDENDNGSFDIGEYSVFTDSLGGFKIVGDHSGHDLYLVGDTDNNGSGDAIDTATGLTFNGILRAPAGSTVLSPITTLIAELIASGDAADVADATSKVVTALGVPNVDFTTFDPVAESLNGNIQGDAVFAAGVQIYTTIIQAASLITGGAPSVDTGTAAAGVITALASQINSNTANLTDQTAVSNLVTGAATAVNAAVGSNVVDVTNTAAGAGTVIANSNTAIQTAVASGTGVDSLTAVAQVANITQGEAADALNQAGQADDTSSATTTYTSSNVGTLASSVVVDEEALSGPSGDNEVVGTDDADILDGQGGDDTIFGGGGKDVLVGGAGSDTIYGDLLSINGVRQMAVDRADYTNAVGRIEVTLASGEVKEFDAPGTTQVSQDLLVSVEFVNGTAFGDTYNASGFSATSLNGGGAGYTFTTGIGAVGNTNQFEGKGGNDTITGNGATRISYQSALAGVTVNLSAPNNNAFSTAPGDVAGIGIDTIVGGGVNQVRGSAFNDNITGTNTSSTESYDGLGGDDVINGLNGFDRVRYDLESPGVNGITVNLGAGTVTGIDSDGELVVGHDTLFGIESVRGSHSGDIYNASSFTGAGPGASVNNGGDQGNFNEFEGLGGNDTVVGNFNTRLAYYSATSGITVVQTAFGAGTVSGDASVGFDTYSNINWVRGSNFNDTFTGFSNGSGNFEFFEGYAGDDLIDGGGGLDKARYDGQNADAQGFPLTVGMFFDMDLGIATAVGGDVNTAFNYGTDTLRSVEGIRGTQFHDVYDATGFSTSSTNAASYLFAGDVAAFNEFEGGQGNDDVTGNGTTRVNYQNAGQNAGNGVIVNLATGATGTDGTDTFHGGINAVRGSNFADSLTGTDTANSIAEVFEGMGGNDTINGMGGFDIARWQFQNTNGVGIVVTFSASAASVQGVNNNIGVDTLTNIESYRGTGFADTYNATGYTANTGFGAGFNEFEGKGGADDITGNGNTRITYHNAANGVNVDLIAGTVSGGAEGNDVLHGGINSVRGSGFSDAIRGSTGNDTLIGNAGNDAFVYITPNVGNDQITDFVAGAGTDDFIQFDNDVFANFNAVMAASSQVGADTVITISPGNTITLQNVSLASLHQDDFLITF
jgi:hypothetical protein